MLVHGEGVLLHVRGDRAASRMVSISDVVSRFLARRNTSGTSRRSRMMMSSGAAEIVIAVQAQVHGTGRFPHGVSLPGVGIGVQANTAREFIGQTTSRGLVGHPGKGAGLGVVAEDIGSGLSPDRASKDLTAGPIRNPSDRLAWIEPSDSEGGRSLSSRPTWRPGPSSGPDCCGW